MAVVHVVHNNANNGIKCKNKHVNTHTHTHTGKKTNQAATDRHWKPNVDGTQKKVEELPDNEMVTTK